MVRFRGGIPKVFSTENIFDKISNLPEAQRPKLVHSIYFRNDEIIKAMARHFFNMNKKFHGEK